jgi:hypothetical protein
MICQKRKIRSENVGDDDVVRDGAQAEGGALNPDSLPFDEDEASDAEDDPSDIRDNTRGWVAPHNRKEKYDEHRYENENLALWSLCHYKRPDSKQKSDPDSDEVVRYAHPSKNTRFDP